EKSRSWELGTKWDVMDERLSLTAAVFQTDKTDARSTDPATGDVSLSGSNRVRGLELSATGAITPKWDIWAGYTYLDPKIKKYRNKEAVYDGNQIKFIAKNSASLWTTYKVQPDWTVGGGVTYVGKRFVDDANVLKLPSHTVYDAMVRYDVTKNFNLQFNVNNITNTRVYDASHVGLFANVGPGRSYMLNATYRFE
uniref:TonB-dependent receptor n=1 Tax=Paenalcaligenes sp. TaxID=1966342 RepID=UPI002627C52C